MIIYRTSWIFCCSFRKSGNKNSLHSFILFKYFSYLFPPQYLAILFFQKDYESFWDDLPGVEDDEKELTEVLKSYQKRVVWNSKDVLKDLRKNLKDFKQKKLERIHFHFSGRIYHTGCPRKNAPLFWGAVAPINFELGLKVGGILESSGSQL